MIRATKGDERRELRKAFRREGGYHIAISGAFFFFLLISSKNIPIPFKLSQSEISHSRPIQITPAVSQASFCLCVGLSSTSHEFECGRNLDVTSLRVDVSGLKGTWYLYKQLRLRRLAASALLALTSTFFLGDFLDHTALLNFCTT